MSAKGRSILDVCLALFIVVSAVTVAAPVRAQSSGEPAIMTRNTVSAGYAIGKVIGSDLPATSQIGGDFLRRLTPEWEVGVQLDLVFDKGFNHLEAYSVVPIVAYSVTSRFPVFFGVGIEHGKESGSNDALVRLGGEYTIFLNSAEQLMLLPGGFLDWIDGDINASVVLALGYTF